MGAPLWTWGPWAVYRFSLALSFVYLVATWIGQSGAEREGISPALWWRINTGLGIVAVLGARLGFLWTIRADVIASPASFLKPPFDEFRYVGAVIAAIIYLGVLARINRRPLLPFLDLWAVPMAVAVLASAVIWGNPSVVNTSSESVLIPFLNVVYLTGAYVFMWVVLKVKGRGHQGGEGFLAALSGDGALKLLTAFFSWFFVSAGAELAWYVHLIRAALGLFFLYVLRQIISVETFMAAFVPDPGQFPLTRWIGWIAVYLILLTLMFVIVP